MPGWEVERFLGRGGSGEVWRAREVASGDAAALKVLRGSVAADAAARQRLEGEAALLAALDDPHLVRLRGLAQTDEARPRPVLVLDHAPGASLAALVAERGALDPGEVVTVLVPLAGVLAGLHATGVVHGDVSPGNVLFAEDGRPLLADLGTAGLVACGTAGEPPSPVPEVLLELTPGYADELRAAGGPATAEGDVHALGACAWHALTALVPGPSSQRPPLVTLRPDVPRDLVDLVEDCLEPDPSRRPDARDLARRAWESAEAEPVRLVPTDPSAPPDEVITHRVRAAAQQPEAWRTSLDEHPPISRARRRLGLVRRSGVPRSGRRGDEAGAEAGEQSRAGSGAWAGTVLDDGAGHEPEASGARRRVRGEGGRRLAAGTSVLAVVGALAAAVLLVLVLPLLDPGLRPGAAAPAAQERPVPDADAPRRGAAGTADGSTGAGTAGEGGAPQDPASPVSAEDGGLRTAPEPAASGFEASGPEASGPGASGPGASGPEASDAGTAEDEAVLAGSDPVAAVRVLAGLRSRAFATRDAAPLARASASGSPALEEDLAGLAELTRRGARLAGLQTEVLRASPAPAPGPGAAAVDVVVRTSAHELVSDGGQVLARVPRGEEVAARLRLVQEEGTWRVHEVLPVP
ncbi:serine/threonine-protein kinase [uncultured Pseudokineococcus sp.]|uniref:serine/threonine-protein kinase n=1 Tax=uncultured Pseudokineococcus sp. TaxID=1642928 RepID=UPI00260870D8|nr:serine/threonine-protein kinase [uncultured Pseudokineococcus sp.]